MTSATRLRWGVFVPNLGEFGDPRLLVELAHAAETAGWDGFFIWDTVLGDLLTPLDVVDPWIALAAVAVATSRIRIGPMVTPLARRRPWKVARETTSLDVLSGGRLVLGVGTGGPPDAEFQAFGENPDARARAAALDRGLELLVRLWRGEPTKVVDGADALTIPGFHPRPSQRPRPPIWVGACWPSKPPLRRAARWDGVFPQLGDGSTVAPATLAELLCDVATQRGSLDGFDVVVSGETPSGHGDALKAIAPYVRAGATWWLEEAGPVVGRSVECIRARILAGPPRGLN